MSASPPLPPPRSRLCPRPRSNRINHKVTKQRYILQAIQVRQHLCITQSLLAVLAVEARQDELFSPIQEPRRQSSLAYLSTSETRSHKQADIRITISCSLLVWSHSGLMDLSSIWIDPIGLLGLLAIGPHHPGVRPLSDPRLCLATLKQASSPLSPPPLCPPYSIELIQEDPKVPAHLDVLGSRCCRCRRSLPLLDTHLQGASSRGSHPYTLFHLQSPFVPYADLLLDA